MHYSFSTVLMTILASNLLIILITFCFRKEKLMLSIGYKLLAVFLILTLIRFLFPFELPFTKSIYLPEFISIFIFYFRHPFFQSDYLWISLWSLFECVWVIGGLICLYRHIKAYMGTARYIAISGQDVTMKESVTTLLSGICGNRKNPFRVIVITNLDSPKIFGILSPRILIPDYIDLNSEEFRFALQHESYHYYHHDLLIKEAINLLCILYWWNPACRLFKKQVGLILEMHVDDSLVNKDSAVGVAYMNSLIHILESASGKHNSIHPSMTVSMFSSKEEELTQRFQMLCHRDNKTRFPMFMLLLMIVSIYLCSYGIILESNYGAQIENDDTLFTPSTGFHAVLKKDGTYDLYLNDIFTENLENLDYYPDIPVVTEGE